jgi:hydrogenase maturation protease
VSDARLTVLGLGNILMSDEGVGVRLMEALRDSRPWPPDVLFVDGGTGGLRLLNVVEEAAALAVFDAADMNLPPGEFRIITPQQLADASDEHRLSLHDVSFTETLRLCKGFLQAPDNVRILAIQPASIDPGRDLSETVRTAFPRLLAAAADLVNDMLAPP